MSFELYVGNYPCEYSRNDLANLFKDFKGVKLRKWFKKNDQKSYSFFACDDIEQVVSVIREMNNAPVKNRKLIVRAADPKLQQYVEVILQEIKCDPKTLEKEESHESQKNTNKKNPNSSDSPPFVSMQNLTLNEKQSPVARKNTKEMYRDGSDRQPFVPVQYPVSVKNIKENSSDSRSFVPIQSPVAMKNTRESSSDSPSLVPMRSPVARRNTREMSNSSNSPPFVSIKFLSYKNAHQASQKSYSDLGETDSSYSKSPSSHSSFSERSYNPSHHRISNNPISKQDDELSECVWLSVTNFPLYTPVRLIYELFDDYEPLKVFMVCNYPRADKTLTEACVCFLNRDIADDVIMNFDNTMFNGRVLLVNDIKDLTVMKELVNVVH